MDKINDAVISVTDLRTDDFSVSFCRLTRRSGEHGQFVARHRVGWGVYVVS